MIEMQDNGPIGNGGKSRRQRDPAQETALAQLFKNAHDAGDADAMRSLGRELQQRGWEYGETVPGWPYIKPPVGFQATPGVDAIASLRAITQRPQVEPRSGLRAVAEANPLAQAAKDLPHNAAALLNTIGGTLAGIPKTVGDVLLTPTEQATKVIGDLSGPKYYPGYYFWQMPSASAREVIEENPVSQKIEGAGQKLQQVAQSEMAKARPGILSDLEQGAFGYGPVALLPGGIPAIAAQTYIQRRGEGGTTAQALTGAGVTVAGLRLGGKIAGKLGESYLSRVLGYTVGPTAVSQIEQAIETGQLPDPKQVGIDAFKNAVFAAGFGAIHGGEPSRARPGTIGESQLRVAPKWGEAVRTIPKPDWLASGQLEGEGILEGIRRIAGGVPVPTDVPAGTEISPASGLSHTSGESRPTYEEMAAKRLRPPGRSQGWLELISRYMRPETLLEKIQRHSSIEPPARQQAPDRPAWARLDNARGTSGASGPQEAERIVKSVQKGSIASGSGDRIPSQGISLPSVDDTLRHAQGPNGSLELSLSAMRNLILPEHRIADEGHAATDTAQRMLDRAYDAAVISGNYNGVDMFIGGTGSGKSVTSEATPLSAERRAGRIILESHAENAENLAAKIDKALEQGLPVDVHIVIRDPVDSYESVLTRYNRAEEAEPGSGKVVPVNYGAATHETVIENVPGLIERFGDDPLVRWNFIDNRGMPVEAKEVSLEEGLRLLGSIDTTNLRKHFNGTLDNTKLTKHDLERFRDASLPAEFELAPPQPDTARYGDWNTIFTKVRVARARESLRRKLNPDRLSEGIDPTALPDLLVIAGYHLEAGSIEFADWSSRMIADLGDPIRPHLEELYQKALQNVYWRSKRPGLSPDKAEQLRNIFAIGTGQSNEPIENLIINNYGEESLGATRSGSVEAEDVLPAGPDPLTSGVAGGNEGIMPLGVEESAEPSAGSGTQPPAGALAARGRPAKKPVSQIFADLASGKKYTPTASGRHHLWPRALGNGLPYGDDALTLLSGEKHAIVQGELNAHLRTVTKQLPGGEVVDMMPRRGNAGALVRANFTPEERIKALDDFYRSFAEGRYYPAFRMELNAALARGRFT